MTRTPFIAGNWKMNLDHLQAIATVQKLAWTLRDAHHDFDGVEVAVFPPFTDLRSVQTLISADKLAIRFGAQDLSQYDSGAYTGDISGAFIAALDATYVIVGHSERRTLHGETNEIVAAKAAAAIKHGLVPVVCVGETGDERESRGPGVVPVEQLNVVLSSVPASEIVVAYEPVWAIGSGQAATPEQAQDDCSALRRAIGAAWGDDPAASTRVLYGGSVKSGNIAGFLREPDIDGALVGGASLDVAEFSAIARFRSHVGL
jgi:triosephosphate isomerase